MSLFVLPVWIGMPIFAVLIVSGSLALVLVLRPWVRRVAHGSPGWDRLLDTTIRTYGLFYGVTLAMIAAGSYTNHAQVDRTILQESAAVAVLYRDVAGLPEPESSELRERIADYTHEVIDLEWPLLTADRLPTEINASVTGIQEILFTVDPTTNAEATMQSAAIGAFNDLVTERRQRLALIDLELPPVLWIVLGLGAFLNALLIALIESKNLRAHLILAGIISLIVSLLLYAIASMNHAYIGPFGVTPQYFQDLIDGFFSTG